MGLWFTSKYINLNGILYGRRGKYNWSNRNSIMFLRKKVTVVICLKSGLIIQQFFCVKA